MLSYDEVRRRCQALFAVMPDDTTFVVVYQKYDDDTHKLYGRGDSRNDVTKELMRKWLSQYDGYDKDDKISYLTFCNQIWEQLQK